METTENQDAAVDFERLREISDDDAEMMNELVEMYLEQTRGFLETMKINVADGNFSELSRIAHKAVGGSATCGMNAVVPFFKELERSGETKNLAVAESALIGAENAFALISDILDNQNNQNKL